MQPPLRLFLVVREISAPFDAGRTVEVRLTTEYDAPEAVTLCLCVSAARALRYTVGDVCVLRLDPL